jgi:hypothetical protein
MNHPTLTARRRVSAALAAFGLLLGALAAPRLSAAETSVVLPPAADLPVQTNLPDPLRLEDGRKITTREQWARHRGQMREIIEHYAIGHRPPPPGNVTGRVLESRILLDGKARYQLVHLAFGPEGQLGFDAAIFTPIKTPVLEGSFPKLGAGERRLQAAELASRNGRFPTIVQPSFNYTPGVNLPPTSHPGSSMVFKPVAPEAAAADYAATLARGYAVMTFYYQQCGADSRTNRASGFFPAYPGYDWGDLAAWAWSMSRCVDYLEQQPWVDKAKIIAVGHSRLGKATLIAGAFDERFALVAPAGSGCGGTGAYRFTGKGRGGKEGLDDVIHKFPQWFGPGLAEFSGRADQLPFDQHWLIDLVAPRVFIAPDGLDDGAANENALAHAWLAAKPVYALLGVPDHLGIHFRPGKHMLAPADWTAILDFADQQLRGMKSDQRFDQLPPLDQLH